MNNEISPLCPSCHREQHIHLQKGYGVNVIVCEDETGAVKIQTSLQCVKHDCIFCKCPSSSL